MEGLRRFRYYFMDLPLWACGDRSEALRRRLYRNFEPDEPFIKKGYETLAGYIGRQTTEAEISDVIDKSFWVKVVREADTYASLRMSGKRLHKYFHLEGIDHLRSVINEDRPVIILTGHIGSFFIPPIAFHHLGLKVYPVARTVDRSPATPYLTQIYLALNYKLPERRFSAKYILSDFSGKIDRSIVSVSREKGIFWVAIDFPWHLYKRKHLPVKLFGQPATLPTGIIRWGIRKKAVFLTGWNSVERNREDFYRLLTVDPPIENETDVQSVLQTYADRLSEFVIRKPWQWMPLPVIDQYGEGIGDCPYLRTKS